MRSELGGGSENPRAGHGGGQLRDQRPSPRLGTEVAAKELATGAWGPFAGTNYLAGQDHLGFPEGA